MIGWLYKWLPIIFGCHCRDDRSFIVRRRKFPICARCTGELAGILLCAATGWLGLPEWYVCLGLMAPMVLDGFIQLKTSYESTNPRRFATGLLFGYALAALFAITNVAAFRFGYALTK